jgi:hypothetical protein
MKLAQVLWVELSLENRYGFIILARGRETAFA